MTSLFYGSRVSCDTFPPEFLHARARVSDNADKSHNATMNGKTMSDHAPEGSCDATANLQNTSKRLTRKQIAMMHHISERTLYMAGRLRRFERPDLWQAVERGEMRLYRALMLAEGREPPTSFDKLVTAWNRCTDEDRGRFLLAIEVIGDDADQSSANLQTAPMATEV